MEDFSFSALFDRRGCHESQARGVAPSDVRRPVVEQSWHESHTAAGHGAIPAASRYGLFHMAVLSARKNKTQARRAATLNVIRAGRTKLGYERYLKRLYNRSTPMEIAPCGQGGSEVSVV